MANKPMAVKVPKEQLYQKKVERMLKEHSTPRPTSGRSQAVKTR